MTTQQQKKIILEIAKFYELAYKIDEEGYLEIDHKCTERGAWHVYFCWSEKYEDFNDFLAEVKSYFKDIGEETSRIY